MALLNQSLLVDQRSDFAIRMDIKDTQGAAINLTGYTGAGDIRKTVDGTIVASFVVVPDALGGFVDASLSEVDTAALIEPRYVYDIRITNSGNTTTIAAGQLIVSPAVTA